MTVIGLPARTFADHGEQRAPLKRTTYWVATDGNNCNPGTREQPFRTIQAAAEIMRPGDRCQILGGVYRETVRPAHSGTPEAPILFEAVIGEEVVVSGCDEVTDWKLHEGNIYRAELPCQVEQLFIDGQMMLEARWPNSGIDLLSPVLATCKPGTSAYKIVDSELAEPDGYWKDAVIWISAGAKADSAKVLESQPGELTISPTSMVKNGLYDPANPAFGEVVAPSNGDRYYLTRGPLAALDSPGEWWQDPNEKSIYLWPISDAAAAPQKVEVKRREYAFDLRDRAHTILRGLKIFGATITLEDAIHTTVERCQLLHPSHFVEIVHEEGFFAHRYSSGLIVGGSGNTIELTTIAYSAGNGITLLPDSSKCRIIDCVIHDVSYGGCDCAAIRAEGEGHEISHNTAHSTGDSVIIHRRLHGGKILYNDLSRPGLLNRDVGVTYNGGQDGKGTEIAFNWIHDNESLNGVGIYLDNGSKNYSVHHNVVWNVRNGESRAIQLNTPCTDVTVVNNTCFQCTGSIGWTPWPTRSVPDTMDGTVIRNNILVDEMWRVHSPMPPGGTESHNLTGVDPMLVDIEDHDFQLSKGSPAIDQGTEMVPYTDGFVGVGPDIGALEYGKAVWKAGASAP